MNILSLLPTNEEDRLKPQIPIIGKYTKLVFKGQLKVIEDIYGVPIQIAAIIGMRL